MQTKLGSSLVAADEYQGFQIHMLVQPFKNLELSCCNKIRQTHFWRKIGYAAETPTQACKRKRLFTSGNLGQQCICQNLGWVWVTSCIFKQSSDCSSQSSSDCINFIKFGTVEEDFTSWLWKAQTLYIIASVYGSGRSTFEIVQPQRCHQNLGLFNLINSDGKKGKVRDCSAVF